MTRRGGTAADADAGAPPPADPPPPAVVRVVRGCTRRAGRPRRVSRGIQRIHLCTPFRPRPPLRGSALGASRRDRPDELRGRRVQRGARALHVPPVQSPRGSGPAGSRGRETQTPESSRMDADFGPTPLVLALRLQRRPNPSADPHPRAFPFAFPRPARASTPSRAAKGATRTAAAAAARSYSRRRRRDLARTRRTRRVSSGSPRRDRPRASPSAPSAAWKRTTSAVHAAGLCVRRERRRSQHATQRGEGLEVDPGSRRLGVPRKKP